MLKAQKTILPGRPGSKKEVGKYGDRLVCVRYRCTEDMKRKFKTVEVIEEELNWNRTQRKRPPNKIMNIRVGIQETVLRRTVKAAGGRWSYRNQTWQLPYREIQNLGLEKRIVIIEE